MRHVHVHCLQRWRLEREKAPSYYRCDQCHYEYNLKRVDAAGIFKAAWFIEGVTVSFTTFLHSPKLIEIPNQLTKLCTALK
jgi:hypothetical protein